MNNRKHSVNIINDRISVIDNYLPATKCDAILEELDTCFWQPSLTYQKQENDSYQNVLTDFRISETAHQEWFSSKLNKILQKTEADLALMYGFDISHLEAWQATTYPKNGKFEYHLDSGYWNSHYAGDRILTFLLYLNTPGKGGGTDFRAMDVYVEAKAGRMLIWKNLFDNGHCDHRMIHSGTPVIKGNKTTLVTWLRQKRYRP